MRRLAWFAVGGALGFMIAATAIGAVTLFGIGVSAHLLVRRDAAMAKVISFDPSTVAARAPYPGAIACLLFVLFWSIYGILRHSDKRRAAQFRAGSARPRPISE